MKAKPISNEDLGREMARMLLRDLTQRVGFYEVWKIVPNDQREVILTHWATMITWGLEVRLDTPATPRRVRALKSRQSDASAHVSSGRTQSSQGLPAPELPSFLTDRKGRWVSRQGRVHSAEALAKAGFQYDGKAPGIPRVKAGQQPASEVQELLALAGKGSLRGIKDQTKGVGKGR
jgi:hypothetical protein